MEIFIIGAIIVAIMAYVSTKIKRAAKEAYEQENVEQEHFTITKPENFIIPVKEESKFLFETNSKDYGDEESEKYYQCWATVTEKAGVVSDTESINTEKIEREVSLKIFNKTISDLELNKSYELEISVLSEYEQIYAQRIDLMLNTFALRNKNL